VPAAISAAIKEGAKKAITISLAAFWFECRAAYYFAPTSCFFFFSAMISS
jgi:hypothetical protein